EMGIGLCLKFIDTLPNLLKDRGIACIAALSPILQNGDNVLEKRLKERVKALGLDCTLQVDQVSLSHTRDQWHFHRSFGIRKFESVYLYLTPGHGRLQRIETPVLRKLVDGIRERFYEQT